MSAIGDGTISYTTATGATTEVATTETTTYHQQTPATAADVVVGSSVRITVEGGFGGGRPGGVAPAASAAPGAAPATTTPTATDIQVLPASDAGSATTATGPERGFGRGGLTGTVTAVGDGTVSISTAGGQTIDVATTSTTTYHGEAAATAADVVVGSSIRVTAAGGFGGGSAAASRARLVPARRQPAQVPALPASPPRMSRCCSPLASESSLIRPARRPPRWADPWLGPKPR